MRVISCHLENFASYKSLDFSFDKQGLCLIQGATGAGKSTLCDAIAWALFGRTAKGGAVDEVISWYGGVAKGSVALQVGNKSIWVHRTRGPKANDLYYNIDGVWEISTRGKDLADTQKMLNEELGFDAELYLAGAYFHEFSQAAQFFTTSAKNRRVICEQLVDLALPKKLQEKATSLMKNLNHSSAKLQQDLNAAKVRQEYNTKTLSAERNRAENYSIHRENRIATFKAQADRFEANKAQTLVELTTSLNAITTKPKEWYTTRIQELTERLSTETVEVCEMCGSNTPSKIRDEIKDISRDKLENDYKLKEASDIKKQINSVSSAEAVELKQIEALRLEPNPHLGLVDELEETEIALSAYSTALASALNEELTSISDLDLLLDCVELMRGELIENAITGIQDGTNSLLADHFDATFRVELETGVADKIEATITKDGHTASYMQLSKGQRQLLKLCFGVSVMKAVANHHSVTFKQVFFDEPLAGLDEGLKLKAMQLFESLSLDYDSLFFIEHSEAISAMINNKVVVELINGNSEIKHGG